MRTTCQLDEAIQWVEQAAERQHAAVLEGVIATFTQRAHNGANYFALHLQREQQESQQQQQQQQQTEIHAAESRAEIKFSLVRQKCESEELKANKCEAQTQELEVELQKQRMATQKQQQHDYNNLEARLQSVRIYTEQD